MPPAFKKDCGLILFDVASVKKTELLNGLLKFASFKYLRLNKSIFRIILVNSAKTKNDLNFPNIYTTNVDDFNPKQILDEIENMPPGKANWVNAIHLALHHLEEAINLPHLATLQLIFFTSLDDNDVPVSWDEKLENCKTIINKLDIYLYFIGPEVKLPQVILDVQSIPKCMNELKVDPEKKSLNLAHKLVTSTNNSVLCNTNIGFHLLNTFKKPHGGALWKVPFTFGSKLSIPSITTKLFRKDMCLKLVCPVQRDTVRVIAGNPDSVLQPSDIVRGIVRHGKFIEIDDSMFKSKTDRCFEIMCFTERKYIPETFLLGEHKKGEDIFLVLPETETNDAFQAFTHLVNILHESDKYAIAKRIYAPNNNPRYYTLIPKVDYQPKCFVMTALPCEDYILPHTTATPVKPKEKIVEDDFNRFFKSLIVNTEDLKADVTLGPMMMMELYQPKLINIAAKKLLGRDDLDLDSLDIRDYSLNSDNPFAEALKTSWPERP